VQPKAVLSPTSSRQAEPAGVACGADGLDLAQHLVRCLAQVGQAVGVAGRQRQQHPVGFGLHRRLGAAQVGHQHGGGQARQRLGESDQLRGVGQLRQQPGRDKGADLQLAQARLVGLLQPQALDLGGHGAGNRLQAVAQGDVADLDGRGSG
jgi:hypothetical protein